MERNQQDLHTKSINSGDKFEIVQMMPLDKYLEGFKTMADAACALGLSTPHLHLIRTKRLDKYFVVNQKGTPLLLSETKRGPRNVD